MDNVGSVKIFREAVANNWTWYSESTPSICSLTWCQNKCKVTCSLWGADKQTLIALSRPGPRHWSATPQSRQRPSRPGPMGLQHQNHNSDLQHQNFCFSNEFLEEIELPLDAGNRLSLTSETQGHTPYGWCGEIFFSKFFSRRLPVRKILEGLLAVRISPFQFYRVRETRGHLQKLWQRDPPVTRGATAPKFGSNFGQNSNGPKNKGGDEGIFGVCN